MRLLSGFFASLPRMQLYNHPEAFVVKIHPNWTWYFLRDRQLMLFLQDPTHLVTKWRNRMLSETSNLIMGQQSITMKHLADIIDDPDLSKMDHGLVATDLNPKDRMNYRSCLKITSEDVLKILRNNSNTQATYMYLQLLRYIMLAYVEKTTCIAVRLYYSWLIVFTCRLWLLWIKHKTFIDNATQDKKQYFITMPTYWSVELNAHTILYLILLVQQQQFPVEILNIYLFNSQSCESTFRNARALSSIFSSRINFTIDDFLQRAEKLTTLQLIKCEEQSSNKPNHLLFPVHHKHKQGDFSPLQTMININELNIEEIIFKAYKKAQEFIKTLNMSALLQKNKAFMLKDLSMKVMEHFKTRCKTSDNATIDPDSDLSDTDNTNEEDDDEDEESENENDLGLEDDDEDVDFSEDNDTDDSYSEDNDEDDTYLENNEDKKETVITKKTNFNGMRVYNKVNTKLKDSYFEVLINGKVKFIHKQTACWILTKEENKLSADRLTRVIQMNKKD
jgi:hypothetical protein